MRRIPSPFVYCTAAFCLLASMCPRARSQNVTLKWPKAQPGQPGEQANPPAQPHDRQPASSIDRRPLDGSVVGHTYTNDFFHFSLAFPEGWKVLPIGPTAENRAGATTYVLFTVGTRLQKAQSVRALTIAALHPPGSALLHLNVDEMARREGVVKYLSSIYPQVPKGGEASVVSVGGKRMACLKLTFNSDAGQSHATTLEVTERGLFLMFVAIDPAGHESDSGSATKALDSLRFFGKSK